MTLEEKLDVFYNAAINDATTQSEKLIAEYKEALGKMQKEHEEETLKKAQDTIKSETEYLIRNKNKRISDESLLLRRTITQKVNACEKKVFDKVEQKIQAFMTTPQYNELLKCQIQNALSFAKGESIEIYINATDASKKQELENMLHCSIIISKIDFMGGTRAVIRNRNILIDNSFVSKLVEEKDSFTFK